MAQAIRKKNIRQVKKVHSSPFGIYWEKKNYIFLFSGFALLILGYFLLGAGNWDSTTSLVFAPIILIGAYILIFPLAIFYKPKGEKAVEQEIAAGKS